MLPTSLSRGQICGTPDVDVAARKQVGAVQGRGRRKEKEGGVGATSASAPRRRRRPTVAVKDDLEKLDEAAKVKAGVNAEAVAVALKVVPLVNVNACRTQAQGALARKGVRCSGGVGGDCNAQGTTQACTGKDTPFRLLATIS